MLLSAAPVLAQEIEGEGSPCHGAKEIYRYCPQSNFPYIWSWSVSAGASVTTLALDGNCYRAEVTLTKTPVTLTFNQTNPPTVPQVSNKTKYLAPRKCTATQPQGRAKPAESPSAAKLVVDWSRFKPGAASSMTQALKLAQERTTEAVSAGFASPKASTSVCTYVYWGCGSCAGGAARVDAYCTSGGAEPDFSYCESC